MKGIVLKQSSARPTSTKAELVYVTNPARGGAKSKKGVANVAVYKRKGYSGNQWATTLAKCTFRENIATANQGAPEHRKSEQLKTIGKCTIITTVKAESNCDARWVGKVPDDVPFTVEGLLLAMVQGACEPLYSVEGKHRANPRAPVEGLGVFGP